jgi:perosamine synthetase
MMNQQLALLGGKPLRERLFSVEPMVDNEEERFVVEAIRGGHFSRYVGSDAPDIETTLRMTSEEALKVDAEWHFLGGPNVRAFAAEFASMMGADFAIPVNSATSGISVALAALGVGAGDEVIVPGISFTATSSAVLMFNSIPVFVDVDPNTFCLDPAAVEKAITPRTKAILPVHLTGNVANMEQIMAIAERHKLVVVEDSAQAIGADWGDAKTGTLGNAGVFSFQQSKNIMTGEGGMIITNDAEVARRARLIINHGEVVFHDHHSREDLVNMVGFNFRLPELCAALGRAQLAKLEKVNDWRTRNADILREGLADIPGLDIPPSQRQQNNPAREVPHMFVALHNEERMGISRDVFVTALAAEGIPIGTGYVRTLYAAPLFSKQTAYGLNGCPWTCNNAPSAQEIQPGLCPVAERLLDEQFLWFYHIAYPTTEADMHDIVAAVHKVIDNLDSLLAATDELASIGKVRRQGRTELSRKDKS